MKYAATVNNSYKFTDVEPDLQSVAGKVIEWDVLKVAGDKYSIIYQGKVYNVEVLEIQKDIAQVSLKINGTLYTIRYADKYAALLKSMGIDKSVAKTSLQLKAPMPGMVLKVLASVGTLVKRGEPLLILEAMKMENIIKAADDVMISQVLVTSGDKVEKNQVIMNFSAVIAPAG